MIEPDRIMLNIEKRNKGLYESYYFRGNSLCGNYGFWLKHNLLRYNNDRYVIFEATFITFDKIKNESKFVKVVDKLTDHEYLQSPLWETGSWDQFSHEYSDSGFQKISPEKVEGRLQNDQGHASWALKLDRSNQVYYHFEQDKFYHIGFPKKKILTRDTFLNFQGRINTSWGFDVDTQWIGMNGHNWGAEHAYLYSYANCNQFNESKAYFDGFSGKIALAGGIFKSPYLSLCSLMVEDQWFHFNDVIKSPLPSVYCLEDHKWEATFSNDKYSLEVKMDGDPALVPWAKLDYDHPNRNVSVILNTKFASGSLILKDKKNRQTVHSLTSSFFELETGKIK